MLIVDVKHEHFALKDVFAISRGSRTQINVVKLTLTYKNKVGEGECVPSLRDGETIESVISQLLSLDLTDIKTPDPNMSSSLLPAGAARNALDAALWDLHCKLESYSIHEALANRGFQLTHQPKINTCHTLSLGDMDTMIQHAKAMTHLPRIKIKFNENDVFPKMDMIVKHCTNSQFLIDPNESWNEGLLREFILRYKHLPILGIEQPLPEGADDALFSFTSSVPIIADETFRDVSSITRLLHKYDMFNVKLDKTGGLTEALTCIGLLQGYDKQIMLGCMVCTSLGLAPITTLASEASIMDLDGPALLAEDREGGYYYRNGVVSNYYRYWG